MRLQMMAVFKMTLNISSLKWSTRIMVIDVHDVGSRDSLDKAFEEQGDEDNNQENFGGAIR